MQFHLNGFRPGDPEIVDPAQRIPRASDELPAEVDVLIVGCGPAGLTLAAQLVRISRHQDLHRRAEAGAAAARPGRRHRLPHHGNVRGLRLQRAGAEGGLLGQRDDVLEAGRRAARRDIVRSGRIQDTEDGLSEFPHVILNQARVHDFYLDVMRKSPTRLEPHYARRLLDLQIDAAPRRRLVDHPVTARLERLDPAHEGEIETVRARYVVGCDGARSTVRKSIGRALHGDSANHAWGVMDVLAVTDFPDIRFKSLIQSANDGSIADHSARRRLSGPALYRARQARRGESASPDRNITRRSI